MSHAEPPTAVDEALPAYAFPAGIPDISIAIIQASPSLSRPSLLQRCDSIARKAKKRKKKSTALLIIAISVVLVSSVAIGIANNVADPPRRVRIELGSVSGLLLWGSLSAIVATFRAQRTGARVALPVVVVFNAYVFRLSALAGSLVRLEWGIALIFTGIALLPVSMMVLVMAFGKEPGGDDARVVIPSAGGDCACVYCALLRTQSQPRDF